MLKAKHLKEVLEGLTDECEILIEVDDDEYFDIEQYVVCKRTEATNKTKVGERLILTTSN